MSFCPPHYYLQHMYRRYILFLRASGRQKSIPHTISSRKWLKPLSPLRLSLCSTTWWNALHPTDTIHAALSSSIPARELARRLKSPNPQQDTNTRLLQFSRFSLNGNLAHLGTREILFSNSSTSSLSRESEELTPLSTEKVFWSRITSPLATMCYGGKWAAALKTCFVVATRCLFVTRPLECNKKW